MRLYEIVYEDSIGNQNRITVLAHTLKEAFEICKHQGVTPIAGNEMPIFTALGVMFQRDGAYVPADTTDFESGEPEKPKETWAQLRVKELEAKGRENWTSDDMEDWCYCQECFAEDERDAEYLSHYSLY